MDMTTLLVVAEFKRLFEQKMAQRTETERGLRHGRIDSARAGRIVSGNTRIFEQHRFHDDTQTTGTLAIVVSCFDLYSLLRHPNRPQIKMWAQTVRALFESAKACRIPVRIFAARGTNNYDGNSEAQHFEWDNIEECLKAGVGRTDWNAWTRQKDSVAKAEEWHGRHRGGTKLTLLCTTLPETRSATQNKNPKLYREMLDQIGLETTVWTRYTKFFALGIRLTETAQLTWGEQAAYGMDNHFKACFPSAARYLLDNDDDLVATVRDLA